MKNKYFKIFETCTLVKGIVRSGICDLQRGNFKTIPDGMYSIIENFKHSSYQDVINKYGADSKDIIKEYVDWLIDNEFGFWCDKEDFNNFPELETKWESPLLITNAILDVEYPSDIDYLQVIRQLIELRVRHIQIRSFKAVNFSFYLSLIELCEGSRINTIDIITPFVENNQINISDLIINKKRLLRVNTIIIYNSSEERILEGEDGMTSINYVKEKITNDNCCGKISPLFFSVNLSTYTESLNYNTCLNRKISIDVNGKIKNCPSMQKSYGNINDTTLEEALNKEGFKDVWHIKKDDIKICQDCEFRHICTDCRAYIDNPKDIYSHPAKCTYNPYQAKWKGEEDYVPVTEMTKKEIEQIKAEYA